MAGGLVERNSVGSGRVKSRTRGGPEGGGEGRSWTVDKDEMPTERMDWWSVTNRRPKVERGGSNFGTVTCWKREDEVGWDGGVGCREEVGTVVVVGFEV